MPNTLLLTGRPGVGKTTIIRRVIERLGPLVGGFYTEEVREEGRRIGFRIVTVEGTRVWLARRGWPSPYRVGAYGVDVRALEQVGVPAIWEALKHRTGVVVDEIGRMELFSSAFREAVLAAVESAKPFVGTIMLKPHPWADTLKARSDVLVWRVDPEHRDELPDAVVAWFRNHTSNTTVASTPSDVSRISNS